MAEPRYAPPRTRSPGAAVTPMTPRAAAPVIPESREDRIREAAYFRAERRAFAPGYELEDWYAAEAEVDGRSGKGTA